MIFSAQYSRRSILMGVVCMAALVVGCSRNSDSKPAQPAPPVPAEKVTPPQEKQPESSIAERRFEHVPPAPPAAPVEAPPSPAQPAQEQPGKTETHQESIESRVQKKAEQLGFEIRTDYDHLKPSEIQKGLDVLEEAVAKVKAYHAENPMPSGRPARTVPYFDYIVLGRKTEKPLEYAENIRAQLNINDTVSSAFYALKFAFARCEPNEFGLPHGADPLENCADQPQAKAVVKFHNDRAALNEIRKNIAPVQIACGMGDHLVIEKCLEGALKFETGSRLFRSEIRRKIKAVTISQLNLITKFMPLTITPVPPSDFNIRMLYSLPVENLINEVNSQEIESEL